ncbi:Na+/H+ antiporter subunit E [Neptuniibacter sp. SY11_33]|uniref:Na+/H+ antiporter subunit E n=1 Tax=Neptuniibacter sp. SY11_33 TaxID=3398215 RepID=UPI0039F594B1
MRLIFPMPWQSLILFVVWLLLNESIAPGHLVLASILAIGIPLLLRGTQLHRLNINKPVQVVLYALKVLGDIVSANFEVAVQVLGPAKRLKPGFLAIPLDIEGDFPITVLASTISLTPGTVSAEVSIDQKWLYVHALNLVDEAGTIKEIKERYEQPLKEIFGC